MVWRETGHMVLPQRSLILVPKPSCKSKWLGGFWIVGSNLGVESQEFVHKKTRPWTGLYPRSGQDSPNDELDPMIISGDLVSIQISAGSALSIAWGSVFWGPSFCLQIATTTELRMWGRSPCLHQHGEKVLYQGAAG